MLKERLKRAGTDCGAPSSCSTVSRRSSPPRRTTLARLTADAQQWQRLAALHEAEARAVSGAWSGTSWGRRGLAAWSTGARNSAIFVLGFTVQVLVALSV